MLSRRGLFTIPTGGSSATADTHAFTPGYWLHLARPAMACKFEITLPTELAHKMDAALAALTTVDALEEQLSLFRETSEISAINRDAGAGPVTVEARLHDLLLLCRTLHRESEGAFDITSTPLSRVWGFLRRAGRLPAPEEIDAARALTGMDAVILADAQPTGGSPGVKTVRFARPGTTLNLGGIGKGYALDRIASDLQNDGVTALLSAGASSFRAVGDGPDGRGFKVGIRDPHDHQRRYGSVTLRGNALGVSGVGEQFFELEGRRFGHILDPRTGWPVEGRTLVAVTAPTATLADALATAFFVGGRALADRYTAAHPEVSAMILDRSETESGSPRSDMTVFGPTRQWRVNRAA